MFVFVRLCTQGWAKGHWPALQPHDCEALQAAAAALAKGTSAEPCPNSNSTDVRVHWFPEWGCALLALSCHSPEGAHLGAHLDHANLHLVAADEWQYQIHM
jgi:hypothetical protein